GDGCAPACASCCNLPAPRVKLTIVPEKYTECVPGKKEVVVKTVSKPVDYLATRCRTVPVCVTDPCTGCTTTHYQQETYTEKVQATVIDFVLEEKCTPPKTEEKVRNSFVISICHEPACCGAQQPQK